MKKRILSIVLSVLMLVGMIPLSALPAFAAGEPVYCYKYFTVWPSTAVNMDSAVSFSSDNRTIYINTTVLLRITALEPNVHMVIRSNATVYMMDNTASIGDIHAVNSPFVKVERGKNAILLFDHTQTVRATNTSVIENNGTLRLQSGNLSLISEGGSAISGSGTLINEVGNLTVKAAGGAGIVQGGAVNFKDSTVTATAGDNYPAIAGNPVNIENCVVTATGGSNAAGIGGGSTIALSQINISGSLITATGGTCGIGAGTKAAVEPNKVVIDALSSVKSTVSAGAVVNKDGVDVFLRKTENTVGSAITVNGEAVRWRGHGSETFLYLYLPEEGSVIGYDSSVTIGSFYITALCDDFPFKALVFDEQSGMLTVKTEKPFSIKNVDPSVETSNHILIDSEDGANITLAGINIRASENAPAIDYVSYDGVGDVTLTTVKDTKNYLCGGKNAEGIRKPTGVTAEMLRSGYLVETILASNPQLNIQGEGFLNIEGFYTAGIGSPNGAANVRLLSGAITVIGGFDFSAIGGGESNGFPKTDVVIGERASVLYEDGPEYVRDIEEGWVPKASFVNENGEKVYPVSFDNPNAEPVFLNGFELPFRDHGGGKRLYFYMPQSSSNIVYTDSTLYGVRFDSDKGSFAKEVLDISDTGDLIVTGGTPGTDYAYYNNHLNIFPNSYKTIRIENADKTKGTDNRIYIHKDCSVKIVLAGVNLTSTEFFDYISPVTIAPNSKGDVTIELLEGTENIIVPVFHCSAIAKNSNVNSGTLTITGKGSLMAKGNRNCAAIGSTDENQTANIVINDGIIVADNTGCDAAAIGGSGSNGFAENIVINGGKITAISKNGAAIGGGWYRKGVGIRINGGEVNATSSLDTAIGFGAGNWKKSDYTDYPVISQNASVKTNSKKENYRNSAGENVYAAKIENESGGDILVDSVKLDCAKHFDEKAVYVYLTGENHTVTADGTGYIYVFNSETLSFSKYPIHEHIFSTEWMFNETYHCHPCTYEGCDYEICEYASFTGDDLKNSGFGTHKFTDFVCVCGFEDVPNCLVYYKELIGKLLPYSTASGKIRSKALEDIEALTTTAEIKACYDKCRADMEAAEKELSSAIKNAVDTINKALDGYKALLETEYGFDITAVKKEAESGIMSLTTSSSLETVSNTLNETLLNMKEEAVNIAKLNSSMEIDMAAMNVEVSSDKVLKTASTAKKAIAASDSLEDILDILDSTLDILEVLGTKPHEHTFSTEYSKNEAVHWFAATCEHDVVTDMAAHTFGEGVVDGNKTTYTCTVCGYEKVETEDETAKLLEEALAELAEAKGKLSDAETELAAANKEKADLADKLQKKEAELAEANKTHSAEVEALKKEIAGLKDAINEKDKEINAKQATIDSLNSQLEAAKKEIERLKEQGDDPGTGNTCPKCGGTHANDFFGKIVCFFNRIGNWFRNLFK